ncbi:STAS domain-containing protein [Trujillonella humicola]|uniref:STAS domain-containing protein n=1 Tax=Trujillonella humicola TaxID=3383699 RepID=UPI003905FC93
MSLALPPLAPVLALPTAPLPDPGASLLVRVDVATGLLTATGELDHCSAHLVLEAVHPLALGTAPAWLVDAGAVTFCDGGGLAALLGVRTAALEHGRPLHLVGAARCVRRLIALTGLDDVLAVVPRPARGTG